MIKIVVEVVRAPIEFKIDVMHENKKKACK